MSLSAYGQELIDLVNSSVWGREILEFVRLNRAWAPAIAFVLAFGESLAVVSLFVPATFVLVAIGAVVGASGLEFWPVWLAATVGAALGDWVSYWIGFKLENTAKRVWPLSRYPDLYDRGERFFIRWGVWSIFIGRFFGPMRAVIPLIAGVFEMPRVPFQMANWSSAMVWSFVLLAPGFAALHVLRF